MKLYSKKGEITSEQMVPLILVIIGFLILLAVAIVLFKTTDTNKDVCKLSVISRATTPIGSVNPLIPLKCQTSNLCITSGQGRCEQNFGKDNNADVVILPDDGAQASNRIAEETANAMYDCWDAMGQGKLDLFSNIGSELTSVKRRCVICSHIVLDANVSKEIISKADIYNYMKNNKVPGKSVTYLQAFTDKSVNSYPSISEDNFKNSESGKNLASDVSGTTSDRQLALIFMQAKTLSPGDAILKFSKDSLIVAGGAFFTPVIGTLVRKVVFTPAGALAVVAGAVAGGSYSAANALSNQRLIASAGYCGDFVSNKEKQGGCSVVEAVPYSVDYINNFCDSIESIR